jgi:dTDP-4-amino-4,6-dideoxygalactose transaminase
MVKGIERGDAIFVPSFTFVATAEAVILAGGSPVFVDVDAETFTMEIESLRAAIEMCVSDFGLRPRGIVPVDLFGHPADYDAINGLAGRENLFVVADAAQSLGGMTHGNRVGSLAEMTATSFFPTKPLGCYGDGGAVLTDDETLAAVLRSARNHGQGRDRYENVRLGLNARLDTIQAAILIEKLSMLAEEIDLRQRVAARYDKGLAAVVRTPAIRPEVRSAWAQYTIISDRRDELMESLKNRGIPTAIYYRTPTHLQPAYQHCPRSPGGLPVTEALVARVLSLPFHPYLDEVTQEKIIDAIRKFETTQP